MHSAHRYLPLVLIAIALSLASCRTVPQVYSLRPVSDSTMPDYSGPLVAQTPHGLEIELSANDRTVKDRIYCHVHVSNNSPDTVDIKPERFHCIFPGSTDKKISGKTMYAYNPETMLAACAQERIDEDNRYRSEQNIKGFFELIGLIFEVAAAVSGDNKNKCGKSHCDCCSHNSSKSNNYEEEADQREHYTKLQEIITEERYWENVALRDTVLYPGESVEGGIIFPLQPQAELLELRYNVESDTLAFPFRMEKVK